MEFPLSTLYLSQDFIKEERMTLKRILPQGFIWNPDSPALRKPSHKVSSHRSEALAAGDE